MYPQDLCSVRVGDCSQSSPTGYSVGLTAWRTRTKSVDAERLWGSTRTFGLAIASDGMRLTNPRNRRGDLPSSGGVGTFQACFLFAILSNIGFSPCQVLDSTYRAATDDIAVWYLFNCLHSCSYYVHAHVYVCLFSP